MIDEHGEEDSQSLVVTNVRLAHKGVDAAAQLWRVECKGDRVMKVSPLQSAEIISNESCEIDAQGSLMLPS